MFFQNFDVFMMSSSSLKSNILSDFGFTETPEVERFLSHGIKKKISVLPILASESGNLQQATF